MIEIKSILCPVDFSVFSQHALQHAARLASWFESALTVLYVYPPPAAPPPMLYSGLPGPLPSAPFPALTVSPDLTHAQMTAELTTFTRSVDTAGIDTRIRARPGHPMMVILDEAASLHSDLIVMGTHGHSGFDRWVLGSVTEKLLRKASCPVLTVPPPVSGSGDVQAMFKRILCPLDFSDSSLKALDYAVVLAKEADAELILLHVIEGVADATQRQDPIDGSIPEYLHISEQTALTRLRAAVPKEAHVWCRPREVVAIGKPYREILRIAHEQDVHLIVMGVHGRNPIDLMLFGSTANHVVRASPCAVLTRRE